MTHIQAILTPADNPDRDAALALYREHKPWHPHALVLVRGRDRRVQPEGTEVF